MSVICKICGKEVKGLELHLTTCLKKNNMIREQYDSLPEYTPPEVTESLEEVEEPIPTVTPKEKVDNIFKGLPKSIDLNRPFGEVLKEYKITEKEFVALVNQWKGEGSVTLEMKLNRKEEQGKEIAEKYKDQETVELTNLNAAETLVKEHGFVCTAVRSATSSKPKTWILKRK